MRVSGSHGGKASSGLCCGERVMTPLHLRRIDPARNMCRFYRLDVQPDLFGRVSLMKQMGPRRPTGAHGGGVLRERSPCRRRLAATGRTQEAAGIHVFLHVAPTRFSRYYFTVYTVEF